MKKNTLEEDIVRVVEAFKIINIYMKQFGYIYEETPWSKEFVFEEDDYCDHFDEDDSPCEDYIIENKKYHVTAYVSEIPRVYITNRNTGASASVETTVGYNFRTDELIVNDNGEKVRRFVDLLRRNSLVDDFIYNTNRFIIEAL